MNSLILKIETLGPWHMGSGEPGERDLDAVVSLDESELPWVPGKTLKGLLREASQLAEDFGHFVPTGWTVWAFGERSTPENPATSSSALDFRAARLPKGFRDWWGLLPPLQKEGLRSAFFHDVASTALDGNGIAKEDTLRRIEAVIPVTLEVSISLRPEAVTREGEDWKMILSKLLPLIRRMGSHRTRGWGRCRFATTTTAMTVASAS